MQVRRVFAGISHSALAVEVGLCSLWEGPNPNPNPALYGRPNPNPNPNWSLLSMGGLTLTLIGLCSLWEGFDRATPLCTALSITSGVAIHGCGWLMMMHSRLVDYELHELLIA